MSYEDELSDNAATNTSSELGANGRKDAADDSKPTKIAVPSLGEKEQSAPASNSKRGSGTSPYGATTNGFFRKKTTGSGKNKEVTQEPLTNFVAEITAQYIFVDAVPEKRELEITATLKGEKKVSNIPAGEFERMGWVLTAFGAEHIIHAGPITRDHARAAIQCLSTSFPTILVYGHTGWEQHDGKWVFLHGHGAIQPFPSNLPVPSGVPNTPGTSNIAWANELTVPSPISPIATELACTSPIKVQLPDALKAYQLPEVPPMSMWKELVKKCLDILEKALPRDLLLPLLAAVWRIATDECDFSVSLVGPTGVGKTEIGALFSQFFGPDLHARNLPGSFLATANQIMETAHLAKNVLFVVDDFIPVGSQSDMDRAHRDADRIVRAQGNHAGRGRCSRDGTPQQGRAPRSLFLLTGEVDQEGDSRQARLFTITIDKPGVVSAENSDNLAKAQEAARGGLFASSMAAYLASIAFRRSELLQEMKAQKSQFRAVFEESSRHPRQIDIAADLLVGWEMFLDFALECQAINETQFDDYWDSMCDVLRENLGSQQLQQSDDTPGRWFLQLLSSAVATGHAHLATRNNDAPEQETKLWGWEESSFFKEHVGLADNDANKDAGEEIIVRKPRGEQIGWLDNDDVYLDADVALAAAQKMAKPRLLALTRRTLGRAQMDEGLLQSTDKDHAKKKVKILGVSKRVLHISRSTFLNYHEAEDDDLLSDEGPREFPGLLPE